ncbi:MAG: hypothetical protein ACRCV9_10255, partial [Burkholderiaceae bacterium]
MKHFAQLVSISFGLSVLAACGGGGGDPPAPPSPPPPVTKTINTSNYLDPAWAALLGTTRINLVLLAVTLPPGITVLSGNDTAGTYNCPVSGSLLYAKTGNARTYSFNNCAFSLNGTPLTFSSGDVSVPDLATAPAGTGVALNGGTFTVTALSLNFANTGVETWSGTLTFTRQDASNIAYTGSWSALRNGRTDQYSNMNVRITSAGSQASASFNFALASPRLPFGITVENTTANGQTIAKAADNSAVQAAPANSGQSYTYGVYANYA